MKFLLILFFSGLSLLTLAQSKDSIVLSKVTVTSDIHNLAPVTVPVNTYKTDSIQNRIAYKDIFNFRKKKISMGDNKWNRTMVVMGKKIALDPKNNLSLLDINSLVHNIYSKKDNQKLTLQKRLIQQERDNYVRQIFTPALVEKFSKMHNDDSLSMFIARYAPSYNQIQTMNELDLGGYILANMKLFRQHLPIKDTLNHQ